MSAPPPGRPDVGRTDLPPGRARRIAIAPIRLYQRVISPLLPPACRFTPTCSAYAIEAIAVHGVLRGLWLALKRLSRCRPGGGWGHDPVPPPVRRSPPEE